MLIQFGVTLPLEALNEKKGREKNEKEKEENPKKTKQNFELMDMLLAKPQRPYPPNFTLLRRKYSLNP
jgi:hypothetical protein